jgi:hypothetical protein
MGVTAKQRELKAARVAAQSAATSVAVVAEPASEASDAEQTPTGDVRADPQRWATIETAARIVRALGEEHFTPQLLLLRITRLLGPELALELLDEALRIDGAGGELLPSGGRPAALHGSRPRVQKLRRTQPVGRKRLPRRTPISCGRRTPARRKACIFSSGAGRAQA